MCFNAYASFASAAVLSVAGAAALSRPMPKRFIFLAAYPVLFSIQQAAEGITWLALNGTVAPGWGSNSAYIFLFFAQVIWPFWIPFSMLLIEENKTRKMILSYLVIIGSLLSAVLLFNISVSELNIRIGTHHHIQYDLHVRPEYVNVVNIIYLIVTVMPPFISGFKRMYLLGAAIFTAYLISKLFFGDSVISVWCYFAAVISVIVIYLLNSNPEKAKMRAFGGRNTHHR